MIINRSADRVTATVRAYIYGPKYETVFFVIIWPVHINQQLLALGCVT